MCKKDLLCVLQYTVDREIFHVKMICVKNFHGVEFRGLFNLQIFNGSRLQSGQVPGAFVYY